MDLVSLGPALIVLGVQLLKILFGAALCGIGVLGIVFVVFLVGEAIKSALLELTNRKK